MNPLFLPKGSVRSIMTLAVLGAVIYLALVGHSSEATGALIALLSTMGREYFASRADDGK